MKPDKAVSTILERLSEMAPVEMWAWRLDHRLEIRRAIALGRCPAWDAYYAKMQALVQQYYGKGHTAAAATIREVSDTLKAQLSYDEARRLYDVALTLPKNQVNDGVRNITKGLVEPWEGVTRWVRKDRVDREDGSTKNVTVGSRVTTQLPSTRGRSAGVVLRTGTSAAADAKAAVGTTQAVEIRFDPERSVEAEDTSPVTQTAQPWDAKPKWLAYGSDGDKQTLVPAPPLAQRREYFQNFDAWWFPFANVFGLSRHHPLRDVVVTSWAPGFAKKKKYSVGFVDRSEPRAPLAGSVQDPDFDTLAEVRDQLKWLWEHNVNAS